MAGPAADLSLPFPSGAALHASPPAPDDDMTTPISFADRAERTFATLDGSALNGASEHLHALRRDGLARVRALGLPTRRMEAWKYTRIEKAVERHLIGDLGGMRVTVGGGAAVTADDVAALRIPGLTGPCVVMVNGVVRADLSTAPVLDGGAYAGGFAHAPAALRPLFEARLGAHDRRETEVFSALNAAFLADAAVVYAPAGVTMDETVTVLHIVAPESGAAAFVPSRLVVVAEAGAAVRVVERAVVVGDAQAFLVPVTEVSVAEGADVRHVRVQDAGMTTDEVSSTEVVQTGASVFDTLTVTLSGATVRNHVRILPDAEFCESHLRGFFFGQGAMTVDNATFVDHAKPNCESNEVYKGILDGTSTGVFNGRILVRKDAQKTNAYQSSRAIVLSEGATMNSKPELEIYADDVKCSHGAATGRLDEQALFYLRARGLRPADARALLLLAFSRDVTATAAPAALADWIDARLRALRGADEFA